MIDTIKFLVPIEDVLFLQKIKATFTENKKENLKTGEIAFAYYSSEVEVGSYSKNIIIRLEEKYYSGFSIEFSVPKYERGNNVEMIHASDLNKILEKFYNEICLHLGVILPHFSTWPISRLDVCYNWILKDLEEAKNVMGFIQRIDYPRKQKYIYDTSVMYKGRAYTIKFYLKGPEFKKHDYKDITEEDERKMSELRDLKKDDRKYIRRAPELQAWADKILRFEIGFRKKYLEEVFGYKPLLVKHLQDDKNIEFVLSHYLKDKVFFYINTKHTTETQLEEILYSNFTKAKATRLYQFYKSFYIENGAIKSRMLSGGLNRSTIYHYKKDLKRVGVGFDIANIGCESILEKLVIPSENSKFDLVDLSEEKKLVPDDAEVV